MNATQYSENPFIDEDLSPAEDEVSPLPTSGPSLVLDPGRQALQHLISRPVPEGELVSLIEATFSSGRARDIVEWLGENDVQPFIDAVDEVCHHVSNL